MRCIALLLLLLCASSVHAATVLDKSVISAGGSLMTNGTTQLSANLGDVIAGVSTTGTTEVQHGFWTTPENQVIGVEGPRVTFVFFLNQAQPSPSRHATTIEFGLPIESHVIINIYDVSGRLVRQLVNGNMHAGVFRQTWDLRTNAGVRVRSGLYFFQLSTRTFTAARKVVVLK